MRGDVAIRAEGLRKRYRIGGAVPYRVLRDSVMQTLRKPWRIGRHAGADEFIWALDGVSFELRQGEIVGVIGRNGAGKSTLLKVLSRITEPTEGMAELHGRVGSLLEVGTGFHPELTGRENVYLNGAILGMRRGEITAKLPDIVEFAGPEVERLMDTALKFYSTGMAVRLGFGVAAYLEPEILIVDEVLAVGDVAFQERCLGKMQEAAGGGRTVLFVSHNMNSVSTLCPTSMWLDAGKIVFQGPSDEAITRYVAASRESLAELEARTDRRGSGSVRVTRLLVEDLSGTPCDTIRSGEGIRFVLEYRSTLPRLHGLRANIVLGTGTYRGLLSLVSDVTGSDLGGAPPSGRLVCTVPELPLMPGHYEIRFTCLLGDEVVDKLPQAGTITVTHGDFFGTGKLPRDTAYFGPLLVRHSWEVEPALKTVPVASELGT
jgi:lipopolysaccharide transport system ATP-binding protein